MARMLPDSTPARLPQHLAQVYSALKQVNSDDLVCRISYRIGARNHPDFLVIHKDRCVFLIAVSGAKSADIENAFQADLLNPGGGAELLDLPQSHSLDAFTAAIVEQIGNPDLPIQKWILFPKASDQSVSRFAEAWNGPPQEFLGSTQCRSPALLARFEAAADAILDAESLQRIIGHFAPERTIPDGWVTVAEGRPADTASIQTDFFLDVDQEAAMKRDLELSAEGFEAASRGTTRLITGTAGCGKTLIILLRARLASTLSSSDRVLILMHNRPLRADLQSRARELGFSGSIEWRTFYGWIRQYLEYEIIPRSEAREFIARALQERDLDGEFTVDFISGEFDWISENAIPSPTLDWYLEVNRTGRVRSLQPSQRRRIYELYLSYRNYLSAANFEDWATIPRLFLKHHRDGTIRPPPYDWIYIDEAQFFAPVWFECVRRVLNPERGRLFLAADPTQGFLRSGQSWLQVLGTEVRGRSQRLRQPYRNTRGILEFARRFYLSRLAEEDEEINLPDDSMLANLPAGPPPSLLHANRSGDTTRILIEQLRLIVSDHEKTPNILVIDAAGAGKEYLLRPLRAVFGDRVVDAENATTRHAIRITTINACTGIEAAFVFLVGADSLLEREAALQLDPTERSRLFLTNTKKLYVAMTRAAQRLTIIHTRPSTAQTLRGLA